MATPSGAGGPTWTVEYQTEGLGPGPDGKPVDGVKVGFVTASGVHASVFIPRLTYNANTVRAAIIERYAHIEAVNKLSG